MLVVGLGNPGVEYEETRHNLGFKVVETLADNLEISVKKKSYKSLWGEGKIDDKRVFLAKPQTFVNLSGKSVLALLKGLGLDTASLLIIHDDMDLSLGEVRIKKAGGSGGHNGLKSIIKTLGTEDFGRIRVGIGRPSGRQDPAIYVLKLFTKIQKEDAEFAISRAVEAVLLIIKDGYEIAMNKFNKR
ncbi:aminoacyl-tRNA hydrolase [Candidatus Oleimmundimicrobium sp.]|uniref:aminoacyl-tRNA hydrolase n=1 Tax=Candidatus Oleimmundimicrobium sp. TaxID=3060597 RepID=UPI002726B82B|nr:aminoacyl-tRNA hydrolase [Candidatus Oleimmundimicrobium sp.]MDO8886297.1 aminoacyl-tRNA hydrolase [Candidatus Oleimmundimicrobium sp.]